MRKIAICLTKGGVGKTTTAVNLAAGLALTGCRILLVDTDTQGHMSFMLGLEPTVGLAELIAGDIRLEDAIVQARERLWLLAGGGALAGIKMLMTQQDAGGEQALIQALAPLADSYDYVILDTSPGWDVMTINVLLYAHEVLVPVSPEALAIKSLVEFATSLAAIQEYNTELSLKYVLPTFLDGRVRKSMEILGQIRAYYSQQLCPPIRYNVRLSEAAGHGQTIYEYAPRSAGAGDYQKLTERITQDDRT